MNVPIWDRVISTLLRTYGKFFRATCPHGRTRRVSILRVLPSTLLGTSIFKIQMVTHDAARQVNKGIGRIRISGFTLPVGTTVTIGLPYVRNSGRTRNFIGLATIARLSFNIATGHIDRPIARGFNNVQRRIHYGRSSPFNPIQPG